MLDGKNQPQECTAGESRETFRIFRCTRSARDTIPLRKLLTRYWRSYRGEFFGGQLGKARFDGSFTGLSMQMRMWVQIQMQIPTVCQTLAGPRAAPPPTSDRRLSYQVSFVIYVLDTKVVLACTLSPRTTRRSSARDTILCCFNHFSRDKGG